MVTRFIPLFVLYCRSQNYSDIRFTYNESRTVSNFFEIKYPHSPSTACRVALPNVACVLRRMRTFPYSRGERTTQWDAYGDTTTYHPSHPFFVRCGPYRQFLLLLPRTVQVAAAYTLISTLIRHQALLPTTPFTPQGSNSVMHSYHDIGYWCRQLLLRIRW